MEKRKENWKRLSVSLLTLFVIINAVAFFHAYKFTHFANNVIKTEKPENLSATDKLKTLVFGVNNPRPVNKKKPNRYFYTFELQSNKKISCWFIPSENAGSENRTIKGTVLLFHGYSGEKASMLDKAEEFLKLGYNTVLVDFMGSGESEGDQTTVGYKEAEEVKTVFDYMVNKGEKNIFLFGTSMGSVAVLKAVSCYQLPTKAIIIECPFGTMFETVCARFRIMHLPTFPMAALLVFWGGVQNGFWAFGHNPIEYAKGVKCNTLLMYGDQDKNVSRSETNEIYSNLAGPKKLKILSSTGHENFLLKNHDEWIQTISDFLSTN